MLLQLSVKNLGIIADLDWKLDCGFNVITGETGAGKSLIIDAVELLLTGSSANKDIVRSGAEKAVVEGIFELNGDEKSSSLRKFLVDCGLFSADDPLVISCELKPPKTGLVRVNGRAVTKTVLREIGDLLIDIHGQSEHLSLLERKNHLNLLDSFARLFEDRAQFAENYRQLQELESKLKALSQRREDLARQRDFLEYQVNEIESAKLNDGEDALLEKERQRISQTEKLGEYSTLAHELIAGGNSSTDYSSALGRLAEARKNLKKLSDLDSSLGQNLSALEQALYSLEEIARELQAYQTNLESDPGRLAEIEDRLSLLSGLKRKYGGSLAGVLSYLAKSKTALAVLDYSRENENTLAASRQALKEEMSQQAARLSAARLLAAQKLQKAVANELDDLGMGQMRFCVAVVQKEAPEGLSGPSGNSLDFDQDGFDQVEFLISTNPGEPSKGLANIASTGEISRFTLALKAALAEADRVPVLIFDEIDIGVGARSGEVLGKKLWALSRQHQVICVTHLAQIAAFADAHYCVRKTVADERTTSVIERLSAGSHLSELAAMLSGANYSPTALKNAQELAQKADRWKNPPPDRPDPLRLF
jgi:DNA repair protein RecN (Recombination protein N)